MTLAAWSAQPRRALGRGRRARSGERRARVWRLYLAGSRLGFDRNDIQLHQILGVRLDGVARADAPAPRLVIAVRR